jgi:phosphatidylglycerol:prolipoprotein diacylglycerol transferase
MQFPDIDPVALALGPIVIRWYALAYIAGILLGWFYARYLVRRLYDGRPDLNDIDDFVSWSIVGIMLGGRLGYVFFYNAGYYFEHPLEALKIWQGGMSFHGGVLGMIGAMLIFSAVRKFSFLRLADIVTAVVPVGLFFGRIANFINGELFGRVTDKPWGVVFPHGGELPRHPSQLYEAALEGLVLLIILAVLMHIKWVRARSGFVAGAFLVGYGCFRMLVELVREPDAHIGFLFEYVSMGQLLSLPMVLVGVGSMIYAVYRGKNRA